MTDNRPKLNIDAVRANFVSKSKIRKLIEEWEKEADEMAKDAEKEENICTGHLILANMNQLDRRIKQFKQLLE